jgi:hypothetical protein
MVRPAFIDPAGHLQNLISSAIGVGVTSITYRQPERAVVVTGSSTITFRDVEDAQIRTDLGEQRSTRRTIRVTGLPTWRKLAPVSSDISFDKFSLDMELGSLRLKITFTSVDVG